MLPYVEFVSFLCMENVDLLRGFDENHVLIKLERR